MEFEPRAYKARVNSNNSSVNSLISQTSMRRQPPSLVPKGSVHPTHPRSPSRGHERWHVGRRPKGTESPKSNRNIPGETVSSRLSVIWSSSEGHRALDGLIYLPQLSDSSHVSWWRQRLRSLPSIHPISRVPVFPGPGGEPHLLAPLKEEGLGSPAPAKSTPRPGSQHARRQLI